MDSHPEDAAISNLRAASKNAAAILRASCDAEDALAEMDSRLSLKLDKLGAASDDVAPLRAQSMAAKALDARINRAVSPATSLLRSFSQAESLQRRLLRLSEAGAWRRRRGLPALLEYLDCVDRLDAAIGSVAAECEPAVQRLQEAVEFLSRTKSAEARRVRRLNEAVAAVRELYEGEVDEMRYEGMLDEALLQLQDEYERLLLQLRHRGIDEESPPAAAEDAAAAAGDGHELGSEMEVEVLRRISETLARNDCLDICIDIFVKVRYRGTAKALLKLNPSYLKTYSPEEIDVMDWESLESAIATWLLHLDLAVNGVLASEKRLCSRVLGDVMDGLLWPECFAKVADKIMAVFFRFGEGVARSAKEPHKLFKLLDMLASMERMHPRFAGTFDGDAGADIRGRFRELQKLLVHAAAKVFWEFGLQVELNLNLDGAPPPPDGSVPKVVRYTVNYLKCLSSDGYGAAIEKVLQTEQTWKAGLLLQYSPPPEENLLLRDAAMANVMDALCRNVDAKRSQYDDGVLPHVLAMNTYWYVYMRTRGTELGRILGERVLKEYKSMAEQAAYSYQEQAWGPLAALLEKDERKEDRDAARRKLEAFVREFHGVLRRHEGGRYSIPDGDLREQVGEAVTKLVVPAYARFLHEYSSVLQQRKVLPPDSIARLLRQLFDGKEERAGYRGRLAAGERRSLE